MAEGKPSFNKEIQIGGIRIAADAPALIIAEAGVNHGGDLAIAKELIVAAKSAGADAVKFQSFKTPELIIPDVPKAPYQQESTGSSESQYEMLRKLELTVEQTAELQDFANSRGVLFLTTPFDDASLDELDALDLPAYKVASTDITNLPFLRKIAKKRKPILLSTGMCYQAEIDLALREIFPWNLDVVLLQCTANYPIRDDEANLAVLKTFRDSYDILVGYSDHTQGLGAAAFAIPMGAKVLEKHFTLNKTLPGPDHMASLNPFEFSAFVKQVRQVELYIGSPIKLPSLSELQTRKSLQKALVAAKDIPVGVLFSSENLKAMRTGGIGISPIYAYELYGKASRRGFKKNEVVEP